MSTRTLLLNLARRRVVTDLLYTFGGRGVQMLLTLAGSIVSARALGPEDYGRFGLVMATIMICGTLADAGLTYTAVKFIAQYRDTDPERSYAVAGNYLVLRVLTGAFVATLGLLVSEPLARVALGQPELTPYLQLSFVTLFSLSVSSYPGTILVGLADFKRLGFVGVLNAAITVSGILALFAAGTLSLSTLIAWNVVLPLASTLPAWFVLPAEWLPWRLRYRGSASLVRADVMSQIIGFSKWMVVSTLGTIVALQGDVLLLGRLTDPATVGVYSVALALALRLDTLNQSLLTVLLPRVSRLEGQTDMRRYVRRALGGSLLLALGLGAVALLAQPLIILLYGESYALSAGIFLALTLVVLFDLVTSSLFLLAFPLNRPKVLALSDWLRVGVLGGIGWLLIPLYSAFGAVVARFLSRVAGAAYTLYHLRRAVGSWPEEPEPDRSAATEWV
jgi:O-antigen/teichoic acid export membrane protein